MGSRQGLQWSVSVEQVVAQQWFDAVSFPCFEVPEEGHPGPEVGNAPDGNNEEVGPDFGLCTYREKLRFYKGWIEGSKPTRLLCCLWEELGLRNMWANYLVKELVNYRTYTTNFLESRHQKLKRQLNPCLSLSECLRVLVTFQLAHEKVSCGKNTQQILKRHYRIGDNDSVRAEIRAWLTPSGAELSIQQLDIARKHEGTGLKDGHHVNLEEVKCSCSFFKSQQLPCAHIFHAALQTDGPTFDTAWIPSCWQKGFQMPDAPRTCPPQSLRVDVAQRSDLPLSKTEKYRESHRMTLALADICSDSGTKEFSGRLELLRLLYQYWLEGKQVALVVSTEEYSDWMATMDCNETIFHLL